MFIDLFTFLNSIRGFAYASEGWKSSHNLVNKEEATIYNDENREISWLFGIRLASLS